MIHALYREMKASYGKTQEFGNLFFSKAFHWKWNDLDTYLCIKSKDDSECHLLLFFKYPCSFFTMKVLVCFFSL